MDARRSRMVQVRRSIAEPMIITPTLDAVYTKLRAFLLTIVPVGTEVVQGMDNRVPQPSGEHVVMTAIFQNRLATNVDTYDDSGLPADSTKIYTQSTRLDVQLDCYGANSAALAVMFSTLLRDETGCEGLAPDAQPLYTDDPRMVPLVTGEEQYLQRWTITAVLQWNPTTSTPQQFADTLTASIINVDEAYPP